MSQSQEGWNPIYGPPAGAALRPVGLGSQLPAEREQWDHGLLLTVCFKKDARKAMCIYGLRMCHLGNSVQNKPFP